MSEKASAILTDAINQGFLAGVEFGVREAEKGSNLQAALAKARANMLDRMTSKTERTKP